MSRRKSLSKETTMLRRRTSRVELVPNVYSRLEDFRAVRGDLRVEEEQCCIEGFFRRHGEETRSCDAERQSQRVSGEPTFATIWRIAGNCTCFFQEAEECKDPELAFSEVSGRTFSGIVNRDHVSEAKFSSRNVANSLSRVVFWIACCEFLFSPRRKIESYFRSQPSSFSQVPVSTPRGTPSVSATAANQVATFQAPANSYTESRREKLFAVGGQKLRINRFFSEGVLTLHYKAKRS